MTVRTLNIDLSAVNAPQIPQNFAAYAAAYDYVALVTPPARENAADAGASPAVLAALTTRLKQAPGDIDIRRRIVFMLRNDPPPAARLAPAALARQMRALQRAGALNFGYVADDFLHDNPPLAQIAPALSLRVYPLAPVKKAK